MSAAMKKTEKSNNFKVVSDSRAAATPESLKALYRDMLLMRRFEEKAGQLYGMGLIGGFCHLYIGQEAVVAGAFAAQQPQDTSITAYRNHAHLMACGIDPKEVMAELTGRSGGCSAGKGGSMHMFSIENGFYGGHGIVGAQISIGTGLGFAHKYKKDNGVCLAYMGDGAADQGQVLESYNMAALWKLPVVFIIENNQYSMGTSTKRHAAGDLYKRGEPYGIPGEQVDGMDVFAVQDAVTKALDHARSGKGAYVLEMMTYRYRGHSMSDPAKYRTKEEVAEIKDSRDPIMQVKSMLLDGVVPEEEVKAIDKEVKAIVNEAAAFAQESPEPHPDELWTDILVPVEE